ncbi:MAG: glyoxalase/bleomycin resistance/dioxygenase family protein [Paenibacillus sp.]|jgi:predicted enzyme related to lactoylglutathione lyase|nr:glyoxalase/bleomycin resistance/dioxygenase family protein [Paenibacillus sp.]
MSENVSLNNPLLNQVKSVFIHVSDMPRAVEWYGKLLGMALQYKGSSEDRTVYGIKMGNGITLLLDSMRRDRPSPSRNALFYFNAPDMKEAYRFIRNLGIQPFDDDDKPVTEEDMAGDPFLFRIKDPFDNVIIIHKGAN